MKTSLQKFEIATVQRSQLHEHPKNPRVITESAKKKLRDKMKQVGLLQPIIVNQRQDGKMIVLGGHQRLAVMDSLERYQNGKNDYELDVSVVKISESEELEMLVFLNNPSASGDWNVDILAELNLDFNVGFDGMGFDITDVDLLFDGDPRFSQLFEDNTEVSETKDALREIKEHRKESTEKLKQEQQGNFYLVVVCKDTQEKEALMKSLHLPKYESYASAELIFHALNGKTQNE